MMVVGMATNIYGKGISILRFRSTGQLHNFIKEQLSRINISAFRRSVQHIRENFDRRDESLISHALKVLERFIVEIRASREGIDERRVGNLSVTKTKRADLVK
jgi:hypothetical protein